MPCTGVLAGEPAPMYDSHEARDADIEAPAPDRADELRDRLLGRSTDRSASALAAPARRPRRRRDRAHAGRAARSAPTSVVPCAGARSRSTTPTSALGYTARRLAGRRSRRLLVDSLAGTRDGRDPASPTDLGPHLAVGPTAAPPCRGTAADLGWWLIGRGAGEGLTTDGELPRMEAW